MGFLDITIIRERLDFKKRATIYRDMVTGSYRDRPKIQQRGRKSKATSKVFIFFKVDNIWSIGI